MAIEAARLQVVVDAETSKAERDLKSMDATVEKTGSNFGKLNSTVKGFALGGGLLAAGSVMLDMAQAAAEDAASVERLNQAVINAEGSIQGHAAALDEAVAAGQRLAFSDDQTRAALALMTAQTGDADEAMRRLSTAQNLARGAGIDLATAAKLIGKTSDENTTALSRMGIAVKDAATAQDVLNAVDAKFAGQAGAYAATDAAKFDRMADSIDEAKEAIGTGLLPVMAQMAEHVTTAANAVQTLVSAMESLPGGTDSATAATQAFNNSLVFATGGSSLFIDAIGGIAGAFTDAEAASVPFGEFVREFAATIAPVEAHVEELGTEFERYTVAQVEAQRASDEYVDALGRQAEQAGLANERNTEALHSLELIGGAAAEAAYGLDQLSEATETAWAAQDKLTGIWGDAQKEMGFWEENLSNAESALELLTGEMEENGSLTDEQQRQYDILTGAVGRYQGGIEDTEGAVVDAAVAQANFIAIQDDLNTKLANGQISAHDYNVEMGKAAGAIDPAAGASYGLAAAQQTVADTVVKVVEKIEGLLVKLGLIPAEKHTDISAPGAEDTEREIIEVKSAVDSVPSSFTITANLDASAFYAGVAQMEGFIPHSPAEKGPLAFTPDWSWLTAGAAEDMEPGIRDAVEKIKSHLTSIDLDNILSDQSDLGIEIANLTALRDAMVQLGDTQGVQALNEEIALLQAEMASLVGIIGTDAVQAWIANQNAAQLAAQAAEAALEAQQDAAEAALEAQQDFADEQARLAEQVQQRAADAQQKVIEGLAAGGDAAGSFFAGILADYEEAKAAYDLAALLGVSGDALAQLAEELSNAEVIIGSGAAALQDALLSGLIDESTLQALDDAGGEWFAALYDQLFGPGALEVVSEGWNDITDASLEQLQLLISEMEDGGAEIIDTLVDQIADGAISYEEALALLGDATGEEVNAILEELQRLYDALLIDLAEALATGSDPATIEANMQIIEDLMASLADRAVDTANQVIKAGKSMAMGYAASLDEMAGKVDQGFDPYGTKGGGGGSGGSGKGGSSIYDLQGIAASTYRGLDPTPSIGEFNDWKKAQMEAGLLNPNGSGNAAFYNTYHPGALSPAMGGMTAAEMHDAVYAGARDGARTGSSEGTKSGFTGWQIPVGR
jgi:hypothetical protein